MQLVSFVKSVLSSAAPASLLASAGVTFELIFCLFAPVPSQPLPRAFLLGRSAARTLRRAAAESAAAILTASRARSYVITLLAQLPTERNAGVSQNQIDGIVLQATAILQAGLPAPGLDVAIAEHVLAASWLMGPGNSCAATASAMMELLLCAVESMPAAAGRQLLQHADMQEHFVAADTWGVNLHAVRSVCWYRGRFVIVSLTAPPEPSHT